MPSGRTHDLVTVLVTAIMLLPWYCYRLWVGPWQAAGQWEGHLPPLTIVLPLALGCIFGGFFLSPDLDHDAGALAYRRWGLLKYLWVPYQKVVPHRSVLSHAPVIGTAVRFGYLLGIWALIAFILAKIGVGGIDTATLMMYFKMHWQVAMWAAIGVEVSSLTHILLDMTVRG